MLGPSRVCSLDVDDVELTRQVLLQTLGLDVEALADAYPTSVGNPERFRVMFRVPEGVELSRHALVWPNKNDPDGTIYKGLMAQVKAAVDEEDAAREASFRMAAEPFKKVTVFELRGGLVQDVLPPSIHPGTGSPTPGALRQPPAGCRSCRPNCWRSGRAGTSSSLKGRRCARGGQGRLRQWFDLCRSHRQLPDLVTGSPRSSLNSIVSMTSPR